jgi:tetratricopeptide (TPR) repeat protein
VALVTAVAKVLAPYIRRRNERDQRLQSILKHWPIQHLKDVDPYELGIFHSSLADPFRKPEQKLPPYIPRTVDTLLNDALRTSRFVILTGASKAGKSRTAYEGVRRVLPADTPLLVLNSPKDLDNNAEANRLLIDLANANPPPVDATSMPLLWIDNAEDLIRSGQLTTSTLTRLQKAMPGLVTVATVSDEALWPLDPSIGASFVALVNSDSTKEVCLVSEILGKERTDALSLYGDLAQTKEFRTGMGEYFFGADDLIRKYKAGREQSRASIIGRALVRSAVDWRRAGVREPLSKRDLRVLTSTYLRRINVGTDLDYVGFDEALEWAREPVVSSAALLLPAARRAGFEPIGYLIGWVAVNEDPVPDSTWEFALERADAQMDVGVAAFFQDRPAIARRALTFVADSQDRAAPIAAALMGDLLWREGDLPGAKAALQRAMDSNRPRAALMAEIRYGNILESEGDFAAAEERYRHVSNSTENDLAEQASVPLGFLLIGRGSIGEAKDIWQRVADSGHPPASRIAGLNLGLLLARRGDLADAKAIFRRIVAEGADIVSRVEELRGESTEPAMLRERSRGRFGVRLIDWTLRDTAAVAGINLGLVLATEGDFVGAEAAFKVVAASGHNIQAPWASICLGDLLDRQDNFDDARIAYQQAIELASEEVAEEFGRTRNALGPPWETGSWVTGQSHFDQAFTNMAHTSQDAARDIARIRLAMALAGNGDLVESKEVLLRVTDLSDTEFEAWTALIVADALARERRPDVDVIAAYRHVVELIGDIGCPDAAHMSEIVGGSSEADIMRNGRPIPGIYPREEIFMQLRRCV